jgi:ribosomal protein S18 acetylase RimI-like enzyme
MIQTLTPSDWQIFKSLRLESLLDSPAAWNSLYETLNIQPDSYWQDRLAQGDKTFVAFMGKTPVGMASLYSKPHTKTSHVAEVWGVYVCPNNRGRGIGRLLLQTVISEARSRPEFSKIKLSVTSSQNVAFKLYQSLGFTQVGCYHEEIKVGDRYFDEVLMEMPL